VNYLSVENIGKSYGERVLFEGISFGINAGQKIGFVAKNGTGKTSLLNILSGDDSPDEGTVVFRKNLKVAFLSQEPNLDPKLTVEETIFTAENPILTVISAYEKALLHPDDSDAYQKAFEAMDALNAWDFETRYKQILSKLKLDDLSQKVGNLSGGQKKRLALANALLTTPDLLIMDEPTNHLDLEMIEWLEQLFAKENFTLFMVTHDRYFLERVCNEIVELDEGQLYSYKGNYSYYLDKRDARIESETTETGKAKQLYKKELEWMRRQPKARTTKSKSRIDDFAKLKPTPISVEMIMRSNSNSTWNVWEPKWLKYTKYRNPLAIKICLKSLNITFYVANDSGLLVKTEQVNRHFLTLSQDH